MSDITSPRGFPSVAESAWPLCPETSCPRAVQRVHLPTPAPVNAPLPHRPACSWTHSRSRVEVSCTPCRPEESPSRTTPHPRYARLHPSHLQPPNLPPPPHQS